MDVFIVGSGVVVDVSVVAPGDVVRSANEKEVRKVNF